MSESELPSYILHAELTGKERYKDATKLDKEAIDEHIEIQVAELQEKAVPLSKETEAFIGDTKEHLKEYYAQFGIDNFHFPEQSNILIVSDINGYHGGISELGWVAVSERSTRGQIDSQELNDFLNAVKIGHELYHSTAQYKLYVDENETISDDKVGVAYSTEDSSLKAIEEGLAKNQEKFLRELAAKRFPEGKKIFDEIVKSAQEADAEINADNILITSYTNGNATFKRSRDYEESANAVNELEKRIPNFIRLAERARIKHETLALAREVENTLGTGSYREIFTKPHDKANEILENV